MGVRPSVVSSTGVGSLMHGRYDVRRTTRRERNSWADGGAAQIPPCGAWGMITRNGFSDPRQAHLEATSCSIQQPAVMWRLLCYGKRMNNMTKS